MSPVYDRITHWAPIILAYMFNNDKYGIFAELTITKATVTMIDHEDICWNVEPPSTYNY